MLPLLDVPFPTFSRAKASIGQAVTSLVTVPCIRGKRLLVSRVMMDRDDVRADAYQRIAKRSRPEPNP